jgi:hypothetical protein
LGWYYKRGVSPSYFFRWLYELLTRNGFKRFGARSYKSTWLHYFR